MKTAMFIAYMMAAQPSVQDLVKEEALKQEVPEWFALSVAKQESNFKCAARGRNGERGVMQIKPSTATDYGFKGRPSRLNDCQIGIKYGMMYLRAALDKANGDFYVAALLYNGGLYTKKKKSKYAKEVTARRNHPRRDRQETGFGGHRRLRNFDLVKRRGTCILAPV